MKKDKRRFDYQKAIRESEAVLQELECRQSKALLRDRVRFLRLLKSGSVPRRQRAGKQIGLKLRGSEKL